MRLTQTGDAVTGSVSLGSLNATNATGTVQNGHLNLVASVVTPSNDISVTWIFEGWDSTILGATMMGIFVVRISSPDASGPGSVRYAMSLAGVSRVSSTTASTLRPPWD